MTLFFLSQVVFCHSLMMVDHMCATCPNGWTKCSHFWLGTLLLKMKFSEFVLGTSFYISHSVKPECIRITTRRKRAKATLMIMGKDVACSNLIDSQRKVRASKNFHAQTLGTYYNLNLTLWRLILI